MWVVVQLIADWEHYAKRDVRQRSTLHKTDQRIEEQMKIVAPRSAVSNRPWKQLKKPRPSNEIVEWNLFKNPSTRSQYMLECWNKYPTQHCYNLPVESTDASKYQNKCWGFNSVINQHLCVRWLSICASGPSYPPNSCDGCPFAHKNHSTCLLLVKTG